MNPDNQNPETITKISQGKSDSGVGPIIGSVIIIILIILGGIYFWSYATDQGDQNNAENYGEQSPTEKDPELKEINQELDNSEDAEIENELNQIEAEIEASTQ